MQEQSRFICLHPEQPRIARNQLQNVDYTPFMKIETQDSSNCLLESKSAKLGNHLAQIKVKFVVVKQT